jgi:3-hydroxyisobutyrate dehydrogenase-like beta-hydroxyacid dehydrogenase
MEGSEMEEPVGLIGCGAMGSCLADRLLRAGVPLIVYDADPAAAERLSEPGAVCAASPREVADRAAVVLLSLPSAAASKAVALSETGIIASRNLRLVVETSTIGAPAVAEIAARLAEAEIMLLDAPVSGSVMAARAGRLTSMVAGSSAAYERAAPLLRHFSLNVFYLGEQPGRGQMCKLINNAVGMAGLMAACEGIAMGARAGFDPKLLTEILNHGSGRNWATDTFLPATILAGVNKGSGPATTLLKDTELYLEAARELGATAPLGEQMKALWQTIVHADAPGRDASLVYQYFK